MIPISSRDKEEDMDFPYILHCVIWHKWTVMVILMESKWIKHLELLKEWSA